MNKRTIITEEEKERILNLHKSYDFKPLLEDWKDTYNDVFDKNKSGKYVPGSTLDDKGIYNVATDVTVFIRPLKGNTVKATVKKGEKIFAQYQTNSIVMNAYATIPTKDKKGNKTNRNVRLIGKINCQNNYIDIFVKGSPTLGMESGYKNIGKSEYTDPNGFVGKLKSMFCCGNKLKPYNKLPYSVAFPKGKDNNCGGSEVIDQKGCKSCSAVPCNPKKGACPQVVTWFYSRDGVCFQATGIDGFKTKEACQKCNCGSMDIGPIPGPDPDVTPIPGQKCPSGIKGCTQYLDCSKSTHYHKCDKCDEIKRLQGCLTVKPDGMWGCKTQEALNKLGYGDTLEKTDIDKICANPKPLD